MSLINIELEDLYSTLDKNRTNKYGDWNSEIENDTKSVSYGKIWKNWNAIIRNFCIENDLQMGNTYYEQEIY